MSLAEVPAPAVAPGHLRVRVLATALNFPDVLMVRGHYQVRPDLPFTPGVEVCAEVLELGEGVSGFAAGDRVIGTSALPHGGLAQECLMPVTGAFTAPASDR